MEGDFFHFDEILTKEINLTGFQPSDKGTLFIALPDNIHALHATLQAAKANIRIIVFDEAEMYLDDVTYRDSIVEVRLAKLCPIIENIYILLVSTMERST